MDTKIATALEFLKVGQSFKIGDIRLSINKSFDLEVRGWSQYSNLSQLTKEVCLKELQEIKFLFFSMMDSSLELKAFISNKLLIYILAYDDYGKASFDICSEVNDILKWEIKVAE